MARRSIEIICSACGADTFVRCEPVYDGFTRTGENYVCAACGNVFPSEGEVPFKEETAVALFNDDDRARAPDVFVNDERGRNCRHCRHYVVNPFTQRCGLHQRRVEATSICGDFAQKEEDPEEEAGAASPAE